MLVKTENSITEAISLLQELKENGNGTTSPNLKEEISNTEEIQNVGATISSIGKLIATFEEDFENPNVQGIGKGRLRNLFGRIICSVGEWLSDIGNKLQKNNPI
ncbi:MAG: hypothetical protein AB8H03_23785 [Saprospiraceae bacterium]